MKRDEDRWRGRATAAGRTSSRRHPGGRSRRVCGLKPARRRRRPSAAWLRRDGRAGSFRVWVRYSRLSQAPEARRASGGSSASCRSPSSVWRRTPAAGQQAVLSPQNGNGISPFDRASCVEKRFAQWKIPPQTRKRPPERPAESVDLRCEILYFLTHETGTIQA